MEGGIKPTRKEFEQALREYACKKCFGRGFIGWTLEGDPVLCECAYDVSRRFEKVVPLESVKQREGEKGGH
jgi:hypothetical protein